MQKELNATSGSQFAVLPLVKPVVWFARAVIPVSMQNQEEKIWELKTWSPGEKCFDLLSNSLHLFLKYGDQSGEFVTEHWGLSLKCCL